MREPPEITFSRWFAETFPYDPPIRPEDPDPRTFRGRDDLSHLSKTFQAQLCSLQESYNTALRENTDNKDGSVFHVDFIDSDVHDSIAFEYHDIYFIGITVPLVIRVRDICIRLSNSRNIAELFPTHLQPERVGALHDLLLKTLLNFVVTHEYAHHFHGHSKSNHPAVRELLGAGELSSVEAQADELRVDASAALLGLANLITGVARPSAVTQLQLEAATEDIQDQVLFLVFVIAVGGYFLANQPRILDNEGIYKLKHPPQAMRMNFLMEAADFWCQEHRPKLKAWMTPELFEKVMLCSAKATWDMNGVEDWHRQATFLISEDGVEYCKKLHLALSKGFEASERLKKKRYLHDICQKEKPR